jgi:intracellular septation protein
MGGFGYTLRYFTGDLVPMILFLGTFFVTKNIVLAVGFGIAASLTQVIWARIRRRPIGVLQWATLGVLMVLGGATLATHDARFIMFKPTVIHLILGAVMLKPGWMERYIPADLREAARPMLTMFGFVWAGLMFLTAALNAALVVFSDPMTWAKFNALFPPISMVSLFLLQNAYMRARAGARSYVIPD